MKIQFVTRGIWKSLTAFAKASRKPALVAVAYFGQGASKLLPLQNRGVVIYSYPSLHAKVYAFDGFAFVGCLFSRYSCTTLRACLSRRQPTVLRARSSDSVRVPRQRKAGKRTSCSNASDQIATGGFRQRC
jgi:hypothetical protein